MDGSEGGSTYPPDEDEDEDEEIQRITADQELHKTEAEMAKAYATMDKRRAPCVIQ
jgi:hypothetical protein